jgi:N-acetylglucosaminyl-diphospho-decaprenol L-rhamnosyltransferase
VSASKSRSAELAVVIVNYNAGAYLERCLGSLRTHGGDLKVDVLVIDNASLDGSQMSASAANPWARLIQNRENIGLSSAWNQGIRETQAPFILFLNPDAEMWMGTLEDYVGVARSDAKAAIVGPLLRNADGSVYPSGRPFPSIVDAVGHGFLGSLSTQNPFTARYHMKGWDRSTERVVDWVSGACMLMPREALEQTGGFDEGFFLYGEELDIATRLAAAGWHALFTPRVEFLHQIGVSTGRSRRMLLMHSTSIYRYYSKHRTAGWRRMTLPVAWAVLRLRAEFEWIRSRWRG